MTINIQQAIEQLQAGKVIGVPTDTVYGLSCLPQFSEQLFRVKNRNRGKKLVTMVYDQVSLQIDDVKLKQKMNEVWPGAVTLIFEYNQQMTGFRIPDEPNLLALLKELDSPLYTTSANISGESPCLTREQFMHVFPNIDLLEESNSIVKTNVASEIYIYKNEIFERIR